MGALLKPFEFLFKLLLGDEGSDSSRSTLQYRVVVAITAILIGLVTYYIYLNINTWVNQYGSISSTNIKLHEQLLTDKMDRIRELELELSERKKELREVKKQNEELRFKNYQLKVDNDKLEDDIKDLERELSFLKRHNSRR